MPGTSRALDKQCNGDQAAFASAVFFAICCFSFSAFGDSSSVFAFFRNASRPPRWSTVLSAFAETRSFTERPSASDISVTFSRFGRKRRLVLMFEWLTLWPTCGPLPVRSQRRDMVEIPDYDGKSLKAAAGPPFRDAEL